MGKSVAGEANIGKGAVLDKLAQDRDECTVAANKPRDTGGLRRVLSSASLRAPGSAACCRPQFGDRGAQGSPPAVLASARSCASTLRGGFTVAPNRGDAESDRKGCAVICTAYATTARCGPL